jgi:NAD(P)-dependent dehydrogenase (short-subunit alcohol dehydrogenase family)
MADTNVEGSGRRVADKIAIVTGAASPVGKACAELFADEGATVIATDHKPGDARIAQHDASSEKDWQRVIAETLAAHGRIDILVQTAQEFFLMPFLEMSLEDLRGVCRSNVESAWLGIKHTIPAMRKTGGGAIVNVSSVLGNVALADAAAYCSAASGVRIMTKSAALECAAAEDNIYVNSVQAGAVEWALRAGSAGGAAAAKGSPLLGHPAVEPADVAAAALFLATPDSKYTTGMDLIIDGGHAAG